MLMFPLSGLVYGGDDLSDRIRGLGEALTSLGSNQEAVDELAD